MSVDIDVLSEVIEESYLQMVQTQLGAAGSQALHALLKRVRDIFKIIEAETHAHRLVVVKSLANAPVLDAASASELVSIDSLHPLVTQPSIVQVLDSGRLLVWVGRNDDVKPIAVSAVVYVFEGKADYFFAGSESRVVRKVNPAAASSFAIPTFGTLLEALEHYRVRMALHCSCRLLQDAFENDKRIYLKPGPESLMRQSLNQHLESSLRDVQVRPEQNVDESKPVDIQVTWDFTKRLALIEIKWLGDSRKPDKSSITASHRDARAREGAKQLADYIDKNHPFSPGRVTRGYLVVVDARRAGVGGDPAVDDISESDATAYRSRAIDFNPEYDKIRSDFESPLRMFIEAKLSV